MHRTQEPTVCPYCRSKHIVLNGLPLGRQVFLCRCCRKKWRDWGALGGRHYSPDQIATAIQMVYNSTSFAKTAARIQEMWSIEEPNISPNTVRNWVLAYTRTAVASLRGTNVSSSGTWSLCNIEWSYSWSAWLVVDTHTGYILACHIQRTANEEAERAVICKALASSTRPPALVTYCGFWSPRGRLSGAGNVGSALNVMREELPEATGIQFQEAVHPGVNEPVPVVPEVATAFSKALRRFDRFPGDEGVCLYANGWVITHNLLTRQAGPGERIPGRVAGVRAPFSGWADVVRIGAKACVPSLEP